MSDDVLFWLIALPLGAVAFLYLVAPALIRFATVQNAEAGPVAFDPDETPPPGAVADFWDDVEERVTPLGYEREAHLAVHGLAPNASILVAVFADRANDAALLATFAFAQSVDGGRFVENQRAFELSNEFDSPDSPDGVLEVGVTNSADAKTFPRDPAMCRKLLCEWIDDPAALIAVHREVVREWGTGRRRPLPAPEDWERTAREDMDREFEDYIAGGWFERPRDGKRYMTWPGAYRATWKLLPPVKQILRYRRAAGARSKLADWGLVLR